MKESNYKSYDELPLFLNAATVAKVLGIAPSSTFATIWFTFRNGCDYKKRLLFAAKA